MAINAKWLRKLAAFFFFFFSFILKFSLLPPNPFQDRNREHHTLQPVQVKAHTHKNG
jgi:hypothetical protein